VLTAFVLVVLLSWWSVRWSAKIPVRQLFVISSWVMFFLSFVLLGKGIHALQETGLVSVTSIGLDWKIELLGVYPFYQTLVPQLLLTALIFFWWWSGKRPVSSLNLINARRTTESAG
jgi:high-affinity iron transporter